MSSAPFYQAVVIGGSAGGSDALRLILRALPADFPLPILHVQHLHKDDHGAFAANLATVSPLPVSEPCDKAAILPGQVYIAPANYHLLVAPDFSICLSIDAAVHWSRPSIDVLFDSAASTWGPRVIGVLLSGANSDGALGLLAIRRAGGLTLVQDPASAACPAMPASALAAGAADEALDPAELAARLRELSRLVNRNCDPGAFL